jgi:hypothetical protein
MVDLRPGVATATAAASFIRPTDETRELRNWDSISRQCLHQPPLQQEARDQGGDEQVLLERVRAMAVDA